MLLDLSKIRSEHEYYEQTFAPEAFKGDREDFAIVQPAHLACDIYKKDKGQFRLVGRLQTTLELPCSRCLEPLPWSVDVSFDLLYQPQSSNAGEDEREIEEDDFTTAFYEDNRIDLEQLMTEQFYLSLPMKPLCREDCGGLCPVCGTNLNRGRCGCKQQWEDPRLAVLKKLNAGSDQPSAPGGQGRDA